MTTVELRCEGLEPGKLVAFLALLGAMRAIRVARPQWQVHAWWSGVELRPTMRVRGVSNVSDIARSLSDGLALHLPAAKTIQGDDAQVDLVAYRAMLGAALERSDGAASVQLLSAIFGEDLAGGEEPRLQTSSLVFRTPGRQQFMRNMRAALSRQESDAMLLEALTKPWIYAATSIRFRWDEAEERQYAYEAAAPTSLDPLGCEPAYRLAALGALCLTTMPSESGVVTPGATRRGGDMWFSWPIWSRPLPPRGIVALSRHPFVHEGLGQRPAGLLLRYSAKRVRLGDQFYYHVVRPGSVAST